ncbi:MAG TPA: hypothetical protein VEC09_09685, partial [Actinomycetota bacterium]|nr:hypothetical protein [Actinomycetota bacterium]
MGSSAAAGGAEVVAASRVLLAPAPDEPPPPPFENAFPVTPVMPAARFANSIGITNFVEGEAPS